MPLGDGPRLWKRRREPGCAGSGITGSRSAAGGGSVGAPGGYPIGAPLAATAAAAAAAFADCTSRTASSAVVFFRSLSIPGNVTS
jgi:hypothetical protein